MSHLSSVNVLLDDVRAPYILKVVPDSITGAGDAAIPADGTFDRASDSAAPEFRKFIDAISREAPTASLYYTHVLLPHFPWRFLPSGREFSVPRQDQPAGRGLWATDQWFVQKGLQRHLVQAQYTDALVGRLLRKLRRAGLYDRALVVVAADHGASFRQGAALRDVTAAHFAEVANVPLFVKYPGQKRGATDLRPARTVDILPTISDVLGVRTPWHVDGSSLIGPSVKRDDAVMLREDGEWVRVSQRDVERQRETLIRRNTRSVRRRA